MPWPEVFSILDPKAGYHQILMHEEDVKNTTFSFERGHYKYLRMQFGLKNAPTTFQRLIDEVLETRIGVKFTWTISSFLVKTRVSMKII